MKVALHTGRGKESGILRISWRSRSECLLDGQRRRCVAAPAADPLPREAVVGKLAGDGCGERGGRWM